MRKELLAVFSGLPDHHFSEEITKRLREELKHRKSIVFITACPNDYAQNDDDCDGMHDMKEIMYGYDSVAKLTDTEKEAIPYMILANQFVATAFFAGKDKYNELYKTNKKMTEWIGRNMEKLSTFLDFT